MEALEEGNNVYLVSQLSLNLKIYRIYECLFSIFLISIMLFLFCILTCHPKISSLYSLKTIKNAACLTGKYVCCCCQMKNVIFVINDRF